MESLVAIKKNKLYNLSPQQIIDCSDAEGNFGCFQGQVDWAFEHVRKRGITYENKYPYLGEDSMVCGVTKVRERQPQATATVLATIALVPHLKTVGDKNP